MTWNGIKYHGRDSPISGNIQEFWNCWVNSSCIVLLSFSRESVFDIITASQNSASLCGPMGTTCFIMKTYTNLFQSVLFLNEQPLLAITWTQLELAQEPLLWDIIFLHCVLHKADIMSSYLCCSSSHLGLQRKTVQEILWLDKTWVVVI